MRLLKKYIFLFSLVLLFAANVFSQNKPIGNTFQKVLSIENDSALSAGKKLQSFYAVQKDVKASQSYRDAGYILLLIKLAKYEFIQNKNSDLAIQYSIEALQANRALPAMASKSVVTNCYFNLAVYYHNVFQQNKALTYYDSVIALCQPDDPNRYVVETRYNKSDIYTSLCDYQKVIDEATLGIAEALKQGDTLTYVYLLNERAYARIFQKKTDDALADIAVAIPIEEHKKMDLWTATSYENRALALKEKGEYAGAEKCFKKALAICPAIQSNQERIAINYNNIADFYFNNLNAANEAKRYYWLMIKCANKCTAIEKPLVLLIAYNNLFAIYKREGNVKEAIKNYRKATQQLHLQTDTSLFTNPTLEQISTVEYKDPVFAYLENKTEFLLYLYKKTGDPVYLNACLATAMLTDSIITQTRHENLAEGSKMYWRQATRSFFDVAMEACFLKKDNGLVFYFLERSRAVLLSDKLNELGALAHLPANEKEKEKLWQVKVIEQQQKLRSLPQQSKRFKAEETILLQTREYLEQFIKSLEKNYPAYYQYKFADRVPSLNDLEVFLAANKQSFIHYYLSDSCLYVLSVSNNETTLKKIPSNLINKSQLSDFTNLCSNKMALNNRYSTFSSLSNNIYQQLFQPLQINTKNVAVCTDNFFIPFEALCSDRKGKNYLVYNYNFSYVYSAQTLLKHTAQNPATGNFVGFAPVAFSSATLPLAELKHSASELQSMANFYPNPTLFTNKNATRANFLQEASRYSVVTIFSHAQADTTAQEPVLYLCDSVVHLSELQLMQNPSVQFVLLSACQTNTGKNATGEGIYSLARGFASIGVPAVSATLWKADEKAIYQISEKFNEHLAAGMNKSEALQKAKIWFLHQNRGTGQTLPYYWANMVLIGSSQPVILLPLSQKKRMVGRRYISLASCLYHCLFF